MKRIMTSLVLVAAMTLSACGQDYPQQQTYDQGQQQQDPNQQQTIAQAAGGSSLTHDVLVGGAGAAAGYLLGKRNGRNQAYNQGFNGGYSHQTVAHHVYQPRTAYRPSYTRSYSSGTSFSRPSYSSRSSSFSYRGRR